MSSLTFVDRSSALPDAGSLSVHRLDGGWLLRASNVDVPMACRSVREVLACVQVFLGDDKPLPDWEHALGREPAAGAHCSVSKIDQGLLVSAVYDEKRNAQFVRFTSHDVLLVVAQWAGLAHHPTPFTPDPPAEDAPL